MAAVRRPEAATTDIEQHFAVDGVRLEAKPMSTADIHGTDGSSGEADEVDAGDGVRSVGGRGQVTDKHAVNCVYIVSDT